MLQELLAGILGRLEVLLRTLAEKGFTPLQPAYENAWLHSGQQVHLCSPLTGLRASLGRH